MIREAGDFANQKKVIIPKTTVVSATRDGETNFVLYTCFEHERCERLDGYDSISSKVDTQEIIGREIGECSAVCDLSKIKEVYISEALHKAIKKESVIVVYSLGGKNFLCTIGNYFLKKYGEIKELKIQK